MSHSTVPPVRHAPGGTLPRAAEGHSAPPATRGHAGPTGRSAANRPHYADRAAAGRALAPALQHLKPLQPIVFALPRGGVAVAAPVAEALEAPLEILLVGKLGAPGQPELAAGALAEAAEQEPVMNQDVVTATGADAQFLEAARARVLRELARRRSAFRQSGPRPVVDGRVAIVVDDGLATGATACAALRALRRRRPSWLVLAVPVGPPAMVDALRLEADEVVCLAEPEAFEGVGSFYDDFHQMSDAEVNALLAAAEQGA